MLTAVWNIVTPVTMSQKVSRKSAVNEDKDKRSADSPVKEMKKKMAANAEKEKQAADKVEKTDKSNEKVAEKPAEKADKQEKADKVEKTDKKEKKDAEKKNDKAEPQAEKSKVEENGKEDKSSKSEKEKPEQKKAEPSKQKQQNGRERVHNGVSDVTLGNGTSEVLNGTVSADSEDDDVMLVIDDHDHDELFPELTYDDTSDVECFEPPTPENVPSRSFTRRSQVKAARTPETPRPASDKQTDKDADDPKDKVKKDEAPVTDRKLRSADSPKPQDKKETSKKDKEEAQKKDGPEKEESKDVVGDKVEVSASQQEKEVEIVVEAEANEGEESQRKTDTNYSKSRVKVSPYRRSMRLADQTNTSLQANYTGNNTTMEMDITESSSFMEEANLDDSSYLRGLRSIRGRSSYKPLKEITLRHVASNRSTRSNTTANVSSSGSEYSRPTAPVVGRKRKPSPDVEHATEALPDAGAAPVSAKRMRVLDRLAEPFRRVQRRNAEIVGINTDLPLTAPVASPDTFDPETLKPATTSTSTTSTTAPPHTADNKRCVVM